MAQPKFVQINPQPLDRYKPLLGDDYEEIEVAAVRARRVLSGRAIWHVSSTLRGGGVSEMLLSQLPYVRGLGIDTRWIVLRESEEFFTVTKRLHNNLHGVAGDGGAIGEGEQRIYEAALTESAHHLTRLLQHGDLVYLHDPQTAGLVPLMRACGVKVIWRCHIGIDRPNELARRAWKFLLPYVEGADAYVFSRRQYLWDRLDERRAWIVAPSVDPFAPKNQELAPAAVEAILGMIGLEDREPAVAPSFNRSDGTPGRVERPAELFQETPLPGDAKLVVQISRWDALKDHLGLLECFARHLERPGVHLALAGPSTAAVVDDPEGAEVLERLIDAWGNLPEERRRRVHLAILPMDDLEENGAMVNALQRRADVVVQKSIAEGFGLTVAEAMLKGRPVVASRVGGIQDQIVDGRSGILIDDPADLEGFGRAIRGLMDDQGRAEQIGEAARQRVIDQFLGVYRLKDYVDRLALLISAGE